MYIFQKTYSKIESEGNERTLVMLLPSSHQLEMNRFVQIVNDVINQLNRNRSGSPWSLVTLSRNTSERSPAHNYSAIYTADMIIAECSDKKPNVFYMLGLAHSIGVPVCSCYREIQGQNIDIPFNVHGRQSLTYSLATVSHQRELKKQLKDWITKYENS